MPRSRNIKPSFFTNEQLADQDPLGRLFFIGLWTEADHNGNVQWRERTLKIKLLPFDNCDLKKIAINLDKSGLIRFYSKGDHLYIHIVNFAKHQRPHRNEVEKGTDIPEFCEESRQAIDFKELAINHDKSRSDRDENVSHPPSSCFPLPVSFNLNADTENLKPSKRASAKTSFDPILMEIPECVSSSSWSEFCLHRKEIGKKLTERSATMILKTCEEMYNQGHDPNEAIKTSIASGWTGVFMPKKNLRDAERERNEREMMDWVNQGNDYE